MRFDPDRVVALTNAWTDPDPDTPEQDRHVTDEIANQLECAGHRVERLDAPPIFPFNGLPAIAMAAFLGFAWFIPAVGFVLRSSSIPVRVGLGCLGLVSLLTAGRWVDRR